MVRVVPGIPDRDILEQTSVRPQDVLCAHYISLAVKMSYFSNHFYHLNFFFVPPNFSNLEEELSHTYIEFCFLNNQIYLIKNQKINCVSVFNKIYIL